jgi:protein-tyrosine phosphatase
MSGPDLVTKARGERPDPESIDALTQELYDTYMVPNVAGQMNAVARRVHNVVSISTILAPREGRLPGGLFHGNITASESKPTVAANKIGLIIQASDDVAGRVEPSLAGMPAKPRVVELGLRDRPDQPLATVLDRILPEMAEARAHGTSVLVNCTVGMSRSTAVILGHMIDPRGENMTLLDTWRHVKSHRPLALPNVGFLVQLMKYEKRVRGSCSVPVELVINHPAAAMTIDEQDLSALRRNLRGSRRSSKRSESKRSESKRSESKRSRATRRTRRYTRYS